MSDISTNRNDAKSGPAIAGPWNQQTVNIQGNSLELHSPYSDQSLGVFPPEWGQSLSAIELANKIYQLQPQQATQLQVALWKAGYYGPEAILKNRQPEWGQFGEADTAAWADFIKDVSHYQGGRVGPDGEFMREEGGAMVKTADELLQAKIDTNRSLFDQAAAMRTVGDQQVTGLSDPLSIEYAARSFAQDRLGRDLAPGEVDSVVGPVAGEERAVAIRNAQARMGSERAQMEAQMGTSSRIREAPIVANQQTMAEFAKVLQQRFGVQINQGYTPPQANRTGDPGFESGMRFEFVGRPDHIAHLQQFLASNAGEGRLVAALKANGLDVQPQGGTVNPLNPTAPAAAPEPPVKLTPGKLDDDAVREMLGRFGADVDLEHDRVMFGDRSHHDILTLAKTLMPGSVEAQTMVTILDKMYPVGGSKDTLGNADEDRQRIEAERDRLATRREEQIAADKPGKPKGPELHRIDVTFHEGANVPKEEGIGVFTGSDDSINRFVYANRSDDLAAVENKSGPKVGAFNMDRMVYAKIGARLGLASDDFTPAAQMRIAREYAQELYNRYGAWNTVAHVWDRGEDEVRRWNELGDQRSDERFKQEFGPDTKARLDRTMLRMIDPKSEPSNDIIDRMNEAGYGTDQIGGGNLIFQEEYDAKAHAQAAVERQHAPEMQAFGVADQFTKFQKLMGV